LGPRFGPWYRIVFGPVVLWTETVAGFVILLGKGRDVVVASRAGYHGPNAASCDPNCRCYHIVSQVNRRERDLRLPILSTTPFWCCF